MSIKSFPLEPVEMPIEYISESIGCLLHTILFLRSPHPNRIDSQLLNSFRDASCDLLRPLVYSKIPSDGGVDVDFKIKLAVDMTLEKKVFLGAVESLNTFGVQVTLAFYEMKETRGFLGLRNNVEKIYIEKWKIPVILVQSSDSNDNHIIQTAEVYEQLGLNEMIRIQIQSRICSIMELANQYIEHIPHESKYEYEIEVIGWKGSMNSSMNSSMNQSEFSHSQNGYSTIFLKLLQAAKYN